MKPYFILTLMIALVVFMVVFNVVIFTSVKPAPRPTAVSETAFVQPPPIPPNDFERQWREGK